MDRFFETKFFWFMCVVQHTICVWFSVCLCTSYILKQQLDYLDTLSKRAFTFNLNFSVHSFSDISMLTL